MAAADAGSGLDVFYPDRARRRLAASGWCRWASRPIQLRLKDAPPERIRREIAREPRICARHGCQLIVNDYWREAMASAPTTSTSARRIWPRPTCPRIKAKGVRLGISTHSDGGTGHRAGGRSPDYIALGPDLRNPAQSHEVGAAGARPRRAIGRSASAPCRSSPSAASPRNGPTACVAAGADSVAVITDFFTHADPEARVRQWLAWAERCKA